MLLPVSFLFTSLPGFSVNSAVILLNEVFLFFFILFTSLKFGISLFKRNSYLSISIVNILAVLLIYQYASGPSGNTYLIRNLIIFSSVFALYPWLTDHDNILYITKTFYYIVIFVVFYSIIEFIFNTNIWFEFLEPYYDPVSIFHSHADDIRNGYGRYCSFFDFCISYGDFSALFFVFFLYLKRSKLALLSKFQINFSLFCCLIGVILSNSRAPMFMFIIGSMFFLFPYKKMNYIIIIILLLFIFVPNDFYNGIISSITSEKDYGGSSYDMRLNQLSIALTEFLQSPIFGNGHLRFSEIQEIYYDDGAYGMESYLFRLLVSQGCVGIVAYIYTVVVSIFLNRHIMTVAFTIMICWIVGSFVSLTTGLEITFPIILLMILGQEKRICSEKKSSL